MKFNEAAAELRNEGIRQWSEIRRWCDYNITGVKPKSPDPHNPHGWPVEFASEDEADSALVFYVQCVTHNRHTLETLIAHQRKRGIERE